MTRGKPELRPAGRHEWDVYVDEKIVGHLKQSGAHGRRRYAWEAMDGGTGTTLSSDKAVAHVLDALIRYRQLNPES